MKAEEKTTFFYNRWEYTVNLEKWMKRCCKGKSEEYFFEMFGRIVEDKIESIIALTTKNKYKAKGINGEYYFVLESFAKNNFIVVLYQDHNEYYYYNTIMNNLYLTCEEYRYRKKTIYFSHENISKNIVNIHFFGLGLEILFDLEIRRTICKILNVDQFIDQIFKLNVNNHRNANNEDIMNIIFSVCQIVSQNLIQKEEYVVSMKAQYIWVKNDFIEEIKVIIDENFVTIDRYGKINWQENLFHHETYTYCNKVIRDGRGKIVKDKELTKKIIDAIAKGKKEFERLSKKWKK